MHRFHSSTLPFVFVAVCLDFQSPAESLTASTGVPASTALRIAQFLRNNRLVLDDNIMVSDFLNSTGTNVQIGG